MVRTTVESACAALGVTPCMAIGANVAVVAAVGGAVVGDAITAVLVGGTVGEPGVTVGVTGVAEAGMVGVMVRVNVGVTGVIVGRGVSELIGVGDGVINMGAPNSLHPRSGAAPVYPVIGCGGISSPFVAKNCVMPLSMAGEPDCNTSPLKSSSTVSHAPSGPGFGAATKSGSCPEMLPTPSVD